VRRVFGKKTVYCNDIGCYTLGYGQPLDSCDVLLCMGSSISQASGIARTTGKRTVAYIGDSTFFHSGLPPLVNAVKSNDPITVVILDNHVAAMTGFQPSPTTSAGGDPSEALARHRFSIEDAVRGLGVEVVSTVDPFDEKATLEALKKAKSANGTNVVIMSAPCAVTEARSGARESRTAYAIEPELCNSCSLCIRVLGCPALHIDNGRYTIDQDLCGGCALCACVCNQDAIHPVSQHEPER
jgi:indolepyruvate ferredoxin oxidoreductase alpha subunit